MFDKPEDDSEERGQETEESPPTKSPFGNPPLERAVQQILDGDLDFFALPSWRGNTWEPCPTCGIPHNQTPGEPGKPTTIKPWGWSLRNQRHFWLPDRSVQYTLERCDACGGLFRYIECL